MKFNPIKLIVASSLLLFSSQLFAANLMQVFNQALNSDPSYKQAEATWMAARQNVPISESQLLPLLDLNSGIHRQRTRNTTELTAGGELNGTFYNTLRTYTININQPIFNLSDWIAVSDAKAQVKAAEAQYATAYQDLVLRVAQAYFNALEARDVLRWTEAEKRAIGRQLEQTRERYKVGLIAITDVYEARASYDTTVAQVIAAKNVLANSLEDLRAITGKFYPKLAGLKTKMPLVLPQPANIERWVMIAERQNYALEAAHYTAIAGQHNIGVQSAERLPTVEANGGYAITDNSDRGGTGVSRQKTAAIGLQFDFPVYQGGLVTARTRQAAYEYAEDTAAYEKAYRDAINQTRQSYNSVVSGISQIKADRQTIISNQSALEATEAAYRVGTRTIVDVLDAQSDLYNSQKELAEDQYAYIINTLNLKFAAGTLSENDLSIINSWLGRKVNLVVKQGNEYDVSRKSAKTLNKVTPPQLINSPDPALESKEKPKAEPTLSQTNKVAPYAIQLLSSVNKAEVAAFVKHNKLQGKVETKIVKRKGVTWYEVYYGQYNSFKHARAEMKTLPKALQRYHPWVRRASSTA